MDLTRGGESGNRNLNRAMLMQISRALTISPLDPRADSIAFDRGHPVVPTGVPLHRGSAHHVFRQVADGDDEASSWSFGHTARFELDHPDS